MSLRILLACAKPLVLKSKQYTALLTEDASKYLQTARDGLKPSVYPDDIGANGKKLIFNIYPPIPNTDFLTKIKSLSIPMRELQEESEAIALDSVRYGEEADSIKSSLERINRDVHLTIHEASTLPEILELLKIDPGFDILHFAGHGGKSGALYFEDGIGGARRVMPDELERLVQGRVKILVTGACYSEKAVNPLFENADPAIPAAVYLNGEYPIEARAVELFSGAFYSGLAQGRKLRRSFDDAVEYVRTDQIVGERAMPGFVDNPTPWRRFILKGDGSLSFSGVPAGSIDIEDIISRSQHERMTPAHELFVGRNIDIAAVVELLEPPRPGVREQKARIITLCGEGGIGKTSLAQAVTVWLAGHGKFTDGIFEVPCDGVTDARGLAIAILKSMHIEAEKTPDPEISLIEQIKAKKILIFLDNLDALFAPERNTDDAGQPGRLMKDCLNASQSLRILATCRWQLNLGTDEGAFTVEPMISEEARELFIQCVPDPKIRTELRGESYKRQLESFIKLTAGMPLCVILAVRRLERHGENLETLLEKAEKDMLKIMEDPGLKHLPERLRSLRASLDLSYNRLSESAKKLFAQMSFFPGGLYRKPDVLSELLGEGWTTAAEDLAIMRWQGMKGLRNTTPCSTR